jgi:colanic acid biosynthesis glycosyl transferase WcaI
MGEKQGLDIIIEVASIIPKESNIIFVLCGDGAARSRLEQLAQSISNILWLPLQPLAQLNELLNLADIHLLPQRADAEDLVMPSKLTGMLASGRPIVATARTNTQIAEVVKNCGLVVPPGDVDAFTKALVGLAESSDQREHLGKNARQYALEHLGKESVLTAFENELIKCLSIGQ